MVHSSEDDEHQEKLTRYGIVSTIKKQCFLQPHYKVMRLSIVPHTRQKGTTHPITFGERKRHAYIIHHLQSKILLQEEEEEFCKRRTETASCSATCYCSAVSARSNSPSISWIYCTADGTNEQSTNLQ